MMRFLQCCVYSLNCMIYFREQSNNERLRKLLSLLLIPIGVLRYLWVSVVAYMQKENMKTGCCVVLIIKNEGRYLREFLEFYSLLRCDILVYDNESTDDAKRIIADFPRAKYIWWPGKKRQVDAYNEACKKYRNKYKYMLFFDADEFLVCDKVFEGISLEKILDEFFEKDRTVGNLGINWLIFGSSGRVEYPDTGVVEAFTECAEDEFEWNQLVKSCVKPEKIVGWVDPHLPCTVCGYRSVNLDYRTIVSPRNDLPVKKDIRLYHYFVKNKAHFAEKVEKGMADRNAKRTMDEFYYYDKNDRHNDKALRMVRLLSEK